MRHETIEKPEEEVGEEKQRWNIVGYGSVGTRFISYATETFGSRICDVPVTKRYSPSR